MIEYIEYRIAPAVLTIVVFLLGVALGVGF